jgi:hypothetical protein
MARVQHPVSTIAAPVFDERRRAKLNPAVHRFRNVSCARIGHIGRAVSRAAGRISRGPTPIVDTASPAPRPSLHT